MGKGGGRGKGKGRVERFNRSADVEARRVAQTAKPVEIHKPAMAPAASTAPAKAVMSWRSKGKFALAGGAALGGTAYLVHHNRQGKPVSKSLYNPYTGDTEEMDVSKGVRLKAARVVVGRNKEAAGVTAGLAGLAALDVQQTRRGIKRGKEGAIPSRWGTTSYTNGYTHGSRKRLEAVGKAYGNSNASKPIVVKRTGRQLSNGTTLTHVRKAANHVAQISLQHGNGPGLTPFAPHAMAQQRVDRKEFVSLKRTGSHVSHANKLEVFHAKNPTTKTKSALVLAHRKR